MTIVYPVSRLLANPRVFVAISNYLGGPDGETLREYFMDLLEHRLEDPDQEGDCEFDAEEVTFSMTEDGGEFLIEMDNGYAASILAMASSPTAGLDNEGQFVAASSVFSMLVKAIEVECPTMKDDISLSEIPLPRNGWLRTPDGNHFEGSFHLRSDPDKRFAFNVHVVNPDTEEFKTTVKPL